MNRPAGFVPLLAAALLACCIPPAVAAPILIDLGLQARGGALTASPDTQGRHWNNLTDPAAGSQLDHLVDAAGKDTPLTLRVTDAFAGAGAGGTASATRYPAAATKDYFFVSSANPGEIRIEGLHRNQKYDFTFYGSRVRANDQRETAFTIGQATTRLKTQNNVNDTARLIAVSPDDKGGVTIRVWTDKKQVAGHLGVIEINQTGSDAPAPATASAQSRLTERTAPPSHHSPADPSGLYQGFGYAWENNTLGMQRIVPAPWTPMQYDGTTWSCWGRQFNLPGTILPEQITSQNQKLFSAAPQITVVVDGKPLTGQTPAHVIEQAKDRAVSVARRSNPAASLVAKTTLEYDGFLRIDLTILPDRPVSLDQLTIRLPFKKSAALYYSRYLDYDFVNQFVERGDFADSFGQTDHAVDLPFTPALWLGNHDVGVEWSCQTNANWSPMQQNGSIQIRPSGDTVELRLRVISRPLKIQSPYTLSFALYPTPIKPLPSHWRSYKLFHSFHANKVLDSKTQKLFGIMWQGTFPVAYPGLPPLVPSPADPAKMELKSAAFTQPTTAKQVQMVLQRMKQRNIGVIPYGMMTALPVHLPEGEMKQYRKYWGMGGSREVMTDRYFGELQGIPSGEASAIHTCPYPKSYRDFVIWQYVQAIKKYHIAGAYFDLAASAVLCRNPLHPHGAAVAAGARFHPWFATRELMKRLYVACKGIDPNFFITEHHGKTPMVLSGFADLVLSGEALNAVFREPGWTTRKAAQDLNIYKPDYSRLPQAMWAVQYSQRMGFINMILPEIIRPYNQALMRQHPDLAARYTKYLLARVAVYNIPVYPEMLDSDLYTNLLQAYKRFGWLSDAQYVGPWESAPLLETPADALTVSLYLKPKQCMIVAANFTDQPVRQTLALNRQALRQAGVNLPDAPTLRDAMTDQALSLNADGRVDLNLAPQDYKLLIIH